LDVCLAGSPRPASVPLAAVLPGVAEAEGVVADVRPQVPEFAAGAVAVLAAVPPDGAVVKAQA
jgi:hypothetical protein